MGGISGKVAGRHDTLALCEPGFVMLSGDDPLTLPLLAIGAEGVISTTANVAPREVIEITRAFVSGDAARARAAHDRLLPVMSALFLESNPIPVKTALFIQGRIPDPMLRLPLTTMQKSNRDRLEAALAGLSPE